MVPVLSFFARVHTLVTFSNKTTHFQTQEYTLPQTGTHTLTHTHTHSNYLKQMSAGRHSKFILIFSNIAESSVLSPRLHTNKPIITFVLFSPNFESITFSPFYHT